MALLGSFVKTSGLVSLLIIIVAVLYKRRSDELLKDRIDEVLSGLMRAESKVKSLHQKRIALGFGGDVDLFVDAVDLLSEVGVVPSGTPEHFEEVGTIEEIEKLFSYFFRHGAAAERYVYNGTLFQELVRNAYNLPKNRPALGGAAVVMAKRLAKEGLDVLVGACFTQATLDKFRQERLKSATLRLQADKLLMIMKNGPKIKVTQKFGWSVLYATLPIAWQCPFNEEVVGRTLTNDDVHLILEYPLGKHWGKYTAPRANRLILHSDESSPTLESMVDFQKEVVDFRPSLFILGGLQMMDKFPFGPGERDEKFAQLQQLLANTPQETKIHFEMASFSDLKTTEGLYRQVLPYTDSLGMNEQELPNLVSILTKGEITSVSESNPRVATILDHLRTVYKSLKQANGAKGSRPLTRVHVHTLAFQAILTKTDSIWKNTMSATAKASLTAHKYICGTDEVDTMKARILMDESFSTSNVSEARRIPFQNNRPVSCWVEEDYELCVAPVLVCTKVAQTAGGGDNISSAGLILQI